MSQWSTADIKMSVYRSKHFSIERYVEANTDEYTFKMVNHSTFQNCSIIEVELRVCMDGIRAAKYFQMLADDVRSYCESFQMTTNIEF